MVRRMDFKYIYSKHKGKAIYQVRKASVSATPIISSLKGWCGANGWTDGRRDR